jgi:hypothetical protein
MSDFEQTPRVVIIADRALELELLESFVKLGAKGWTSVYCNGKGRSAIMDNPFVEPDRSRVRIEILTSMPVAVSIMEHVERPPYGLRRVIAYMDNVIVSSKRKFD